MKNTNIKRQAVFPVLMMLVVTALALIGSSFAWFTVANTASVTQITTSAQTDGVQLQLSQDASRYYTRNLKINTNASYSIFPGTLYQVSTNGQLGTGDYASRLKFFDSEVLGHSVGTETDLLVSTKLDETVTVNNGVLAAASKGEYATYGQAGKSYGESMEAEDPTYIVFDLYMSVDRAAEIYLFNGTEITAQKTASNATAATEVLKAVRIAFVYLGSTAGITNEDAAKIQPETELTGTKSVVIWEPSATYVGETKVGSFGVSSQTYVDEDEIGEMTCYKDNDNTDPVATYESDKLVLATKDADTTNMQELFTTSVACYSKLRIYVWLEGNDPDCTAAIASQFLKLNLVFFAKDATV